MPHRAPRHAHVLLSVPVSVFLAVASTLSTHAQVATVERPTPIVIAIDPGHGGTPDNNHPDQPFDPGTIAADGTQEKNLTLDIGMRVQRVLQDDRVTVVMTRSDDRYLGIEARMQTAIDAGAVAFVSIHFNAFGDVTTGGALVLYPGDSSMQFAQRMDERVHARLAAFSEADGGTVLKNDLWVHATMPAVTVEGGYLSNAEDAARLQRTDYRDALAAGIRDGIEAQVPDILSRKLQIVAWDASHGVATATPGAAPASAVAATPAAAADPTAPGTSPLLLPLIWGSGAILAIRFRRRLGRALLWMVQRLLPGIFARRAVRLRRREGQRSRRHAALERSRRRDTVAPRRRRVRGAALYDDPRR